MITFLIITIYGTVSEGGMARLTDPAVILFQISLSAGCILGTC